MATIFNFPAKADISVGEGLYCFDVQEVSGILLGKGKGLISRTLPINGRGMLIFFQYYPYIFFQTNQPFYEYHV